MYGKKGGGGWERLKGARRGKTENSQNTARKTRWWGGSRLKGPLEFTLPLRVIFPPPSYRALSEIHNVCKMGGRGVTPRIYTHEAHRLSRNEGFPFLFSHTFFAILFRHSPTLCFQFFPGRHFFSIPRPPALNSV